MARHNLHRAPNTSRVIFPLSSKKGNSFLRLQRRREFRLISLAPVNSNIFYIKGKHFPFQSYQLEMSEHSNHHSPSLSTSPGDNCSPPPFPTTWDFPGHLHRDLTPSSHDGCLGSTPPPRIRAILPSSSSHRASLALLMEVSAALAERSTEDVPGDFKEVPKTPTFKRKRGFGDDAMYVEYHSFVPPNS